MKEGKKLVIIDLSSVDSISVFVDFMQDLGVEYKGEIIKALKKRFPAHDEDSIREMFNLIQKYRIIL